MLQVVGYHTYEPHAEGNGRVPSLVHDPVQVGLGQVLYEPERVRVDGSEVPAEQLRIGGD